MTCFAGVLSSSRPTPYNIVQATIQLWKKNLIFYLRSDRSEWIVHLTEIYGYEGISCFYSSMNKPLSIQHRRKQILHELKQDADRM